MQGVGEGVKNDEQAIRELVDTWLAASQTGEIDIVLGLMSEDVVFMVPGKEPFGKEEFAVGARAMKNIQMEATSEIQEIKVLGDWAWMRSHLKVVATPSTGNSNVRSGYTLTILRKNRDGQWLIVRDANLLTEEPKPK